MTSSFVTCTNCSEKFLKDNRYIKENKKLGHNAYCSLKCQYSFKDKKIGLSCENPNCNNLFRRVPKNVSFHNFCSQSCYGTLVSKRNRLGLNNKPNKASLSKIYCEYCGSKIPNDQKYCSMRCYGLDRKISKDKIINDVLKLAQRLDRTPTRREFKSFTACVSRFGSWNNALLEAGLTPHRSLNQKMYKRRQCFAKDGHICNSVSELIIDNWLYKNNIDHQKETPYPKGKFVADWSLSSKILIEYFGLANDSQRYDEEIKKKQEICKQAGITLIEIYSQDLFPKNKLDQIFDKV